MAYRRVVWHTDDTKFVRNPVNTADMSFKRTLPSATSTCRGVIGSASHLMVRVAGSFTAIRKDAGLCCGSRLGSGEVFAYFGRIHNLKDLKDFHRRGCCYGAKEIPRASREAW